MKNIKFAVLAFAAIGLIGCFLAFVPGPEGSVSWFDLRKAEGFGSRVYVVLGGFGAALVAAGVGVASGMKRWNGIVAALGFAAVWVGFEFKTLDLFQFGTGAKVMALGAIAGLVAGIAAAAKPEQTV
jgi:hypothetical protein